MRSPPPRVSILMHMLSTGTHTRVHTHTDFPSLSSALVSAVHVFIKGHTRGRVSFWGEFPAPRGQGEGPGEPARGPCWPSSGSICLLLLLEVREQARTSACPSRTADPGGV